MRKLTLAIASALVAGAGLFAVAGPALADSSPPVTITGSVNSAMTVSGFSSTIAFPPGNPGDTVSVPSAEHFTVSTNAGTYSISISADNDGLRSDGNLVIVPDANLTVQSGLNQPTAMTTGTVLMENGGNGSTTYDHTWRATIPANTTYSGPLHGSFTYIIATH